MAKFHISILTFFLTGAGIMIIYCMVLHLLRCKRSRLPGDGLFTLATWPDMIRSLVSFCIVLIVFTPILTNLLCQVLALWYTFVEGWSIEYSNDYIQNHMLGVPEVRSLSPKTEVGRMADLVWCTMMKVIFAVLGAVGCAMSIVANATNALPANALGLVLAVILTFLFFLIFGGVLTVIMQQVEYQLVEEERKEYVTLKEVFYYVAGMFAQVTLTDWQPLNHWGAVLCSLYTCIEVTLFGAAIGLFVAHPAVIGIAEILEGEYLQPETGVENDEQQPQKQGGESAQLAGSQVEEAPKDVAAQNAQLVSQMVAQSAQLADAHKQISELGAKLREAEQTQLDLQKRLNEQESNNGKQELLQQELQVLRQSLVRQQETENSLRASLSTAERQAATASAQRALTLLKTAHEM